MVDSARVLVDGLKHFPRCIYPLSRLTLTRLRLPILRGCRTGTLEKAAKAFDLDTKFNATKAAQKLERARKRAATTDFDRFRIMVLRKQRSYGARHLGKGGKKAPPKKAAAPAKGKGKK
jgi:large subunit ribosomal protein L14e